MILETGGSPATGGHGAVFTNHFPAQISARRCSHVKQWTRLYVWSVKVDITLFVHGRTVTIPISLTGLVGHNLLVNDVLLTTGQAGHSHACDARITTVVYTDLAWRQRQRPGYINRHNLEEVLSVWASVKSKATNEYCEMYKIDLSLVSVCI